MHEFRSFGKIERIEKLTMTITQKVHGTNAQVNIYEDEKGVKQLKCGSRTRWLTRTDDNYGFCTHVEAHRDEFIEKLGLGRHYGEWAGKGINSGEGLDCRNFYLFNHWKFEDKFKAQIGNPNLKLLPPNTYVIPVLVSKIIYKGLNYENSFTNYVEYWMNYLSRYGSRLYCAQGFRSPEGIVIQLGDQYFKKVFDPEETGWTKSPKPKNDRVIDANYDHLMQPIRLQKLFSRDEAYMRDYPKSLPSIIKDYVKDLLEEQQCTEEVAKAASRSLFAFVKDYVERLHDERVA